MQPGRNAVTRRVLGAVLLSLAFHAVLIAGMKPVSARYAGDPFLRVNFKAASLDSPPPGRAMRPPVPPSASGTREPSALRRGLPDEARFGKRYLGGGTARPGNLPDGRDAYVELDMKLLNQYYTAREVDQRAVALEEPPLFNPLHGPQSGSTARVVLLVLINEHGAVDAVATLESRYKGEYDAIARKAFGSVPFSPALKDGKPVKSQKIIEVIYGS